ncbi:transposase [Marinactinospora rubrisoli]|uniref:Transposase n=1 Tax=Marinactinospora rubrisoli TaxID=2715399 RepID=A0ABW2KIV6_9ACTN
MRRRLRADPPAPGRGDFADAQWAPLEPLLPAPTTGRPDHSERTLVNGVCWRVRTGAPWRDIPERYGPWATGNDLSRRWTPTGAWAHSLDRPQSRADAAALDCRAVPVDSTIVRAHQHATGAVQKGPGEITKRPSPTTRHRAAPAAGSPPRSTRRASRGKSPWPWWSRPGSAGTPRSWRRSRNASAWRHTAGPDSSSGNPRPPALPDPGRLAPWPSGRAPGFRRRTTVARCSRSQSAPASKAGYPAPAAAPSAVDRASRVLLPHPDRPTRKPGFRIAGNRGSSRPHRDTPVCVRQELEGAYSPAGTGDPAGGVQAPAGIFGVKR